MIFCGSAREMELVLKLALHRRVFVFILMEKEVIAKMVELIGWAPDQGDAIFSPGGAIANLYAVNAARHFHYPRVKPLGMSEVPTLCTFTSEDVRG